MTSKMKGFKDFDKKPKPPIIITAEPVHGKHSREKPSKKTVKEEADAVKSHEWYGRHDNHHVGENIGEVESKLKNPDLSKHEHFDHIDHYTRSSYSTNASLISLATGGKYAGSLSKATSIMKHPTNPEKAKQHHKERVQEFRKRVRGLDKAIKDHPLTHDLHVYHGTHSWHPGKESAKHPQGHVQIPSYLSTSANKSVASDFTDGGFGSGSQHGKHIIHIHLPKGHHAMYIGSHGGAGQEHEVLLPRKTTLQIHKEPTKLDDGTHVWHAKPVKG